MTAYDIQMLSKLLLCYAVGSAKLLDSCSAYDWLYVYRQSERSERIRKFFFYLAKDALIGQVGHLLWGVAQAF